jgi:very-short-patch-repair endonuclease
MVVGMLALGAASRDARRDRWLAARGYCVVRVWSDDVMRNTEVVYRTILDTLAGNTPSRNRFAISTSPQGGG